MSAKLNVCILCKKAAVPAPFTSCVVRVRRDGREVCSPSRRAKELYEALSALDALIARAKDMKHALPELNTAEIKKAKAASLFSLADLRAARIDRIGSY